MSDEFEDLLGEDNPITVARRNLAGLMGSILDYRAPCPRCGDTDRWTMVAPDRRATFCMRCGKTLEEP